MKRIALAALLLFFVACDDRVHHDLYLTFDKSGTRVTISAETSLPSPKEPAERKRIQSLRDDLVAGRDEWSLRFANANPEHDRIIFDRDHSEISRVARSAVIDADDLQKFFFDLPVSTTVTRGEGWAELTIYPGSSMRATREQREAVEKKLERYSEAAVRYFGSLRTLYGYLDEHPQRAADVFTALFLEDDELPQRVTAFELDLVKDVRRRVDGLLSLEGESTKDLEAQADIVFNPFPARLVVNVPSEPLLVEGFTRQKDGTLIAETPSLLDAVASLEGRWVSPDPIAFALNGDTKGEDAAATIATQPRHAAAVIGATEVREALTKRMRPAPRYRVRFITRAAEPSS